MNRYYKLIDEKYNGMIIRSNDSVEERYDPESSTWIETGVMIRYYSDESDQYGMYEEITEKEALEIITALQ